MNARIVVPSERHVERLASGSVVFETLATFQSRLLAELVPARSVAEPDVARLALVAALLEGARPGSFLANAAETGARAWQRTVDSIDEALTVIRQTGCTAALARIERQDRSERAGVLARALVAQDERLGRLGMFDARSTNDVLAGAIRAAEPARVAIAVGAPRVIARYLVAWDPGQLALWRALDAALSSQGGRALIELPTFDVTLDSARLGSALDRLSDELAAALDDAPVTVPIQARLGDFRFAGDLAPRFRAHVELKRAPDAMVQGWVVAEAVHAALAQGLAPERVAILVPDGADEIVRPIRGALAEIGVVTHDPRGRAPASAPLVGFALRALRVADDGLPRRDLANLIRSQYVDAPALTGLADDAEARAVLRRIGQGLDSSPPARADDPVEAIERMVAGASTRRSTGQERALPEIARNAAALLRRAVLGRTRAEHVSGARALWSTLGLRAVAVKGAWELLAEGRSTTPLGRAELDAIAFDARAWEALEAALDGYEDASARLGVADATMSNAAFRHELSHMLERPAPRGASGRAGAVRLVRAAEVAAEPLDLLVVVDFNEGVFPSRAALPGFFSPALEARLRELDARVPTPASSGARDLAELALAVSSADRIVLVHRAKDEAGAILAPAPIFAWLERGGIEVESCRATAVRTRPLTAAQAELRELLLQPDSADAVAPSAAHRARVERAREAFFSGTLAGDPGTVGDLSPDEVIHRVLVEETGGGQVPMAVTSLERFAACAFQGYATEVLGAREGRASTDAPDAREQGSIVHGALAAAFRATAPLWSARPRDARSIRDGAMAAADAFLEREASASGLRRLALDEARRDVRRVVEWSLADEEWDFAVAEQPFGSGRSGSWGALRLERDASWLALRGAIDRVDVGHGSASVRVIDYKLGDGSAQRATRGMGELTFQLPLYGRAAEVAYSATQSVGLYLPMRVRGPLPVGPSKGHTEAWSRATLDREGRPSFETRALELAQEVRAGGLTPVPREAHACERCSVDGGCRKPRFAISAEQEDEPEGR